MEGFFVLIVLIVIFSSLSSKNKKNQQQQRQKERERMRRATEDEAGAAEKPRRPESQPGAGEFWQPPETAQEAKTPPKSQEPPRAPAPKRAMTDAQRLERERAEEDLRRAREAAEKKLAEKKAKELAKEREREERRKERAQKRGKQQAAAEVQQVFREMEASPAFAAQAAFAAPFARAAAEGTDSLGGAARDTEGKCAPGHEHGGDLESLSHLRYDGTRPAAGRAASLRFSENEAVNGLVWSEILKRPEYTARGRRR